MGIHVGALTPTYIHGYPRISLDVHTYTWLPIYSYGLPHTRVESHAFKWACIYVAWAPIVAGGLAWMRYATAHQCPLASKTGRKSHALFGHPHASTRKFALPAVVSLAKRAWPPLQNLENLTRFAWKSIDGHAYKWTRTRAYARASTYTRAWVQAQRVMCALATWTGCRAKLVVSGTLCGRAYMRARV